MGRGDAKVNRRSDDGLGLIEVMVAMFMLAIIAMAFLPFLINSYLAAKSNQTLATATQLLDTQMGELRAEQPANCQKLENFRDRANPGVDRVVDAERNVTLTVERTFTCPVNINRTGAAAFTIEIVDQSGATVVQSTTTVYVGRT